MPDHYTSPHPLPEGRERELLGILQEEAAEIVVAVSKALRFGLADGYPGTDRVNRLDIAAEIGDLLGVMDMLTVEGVYLNEETLLAHRMNKRAKVERFLQSKRGE